ncbi:MAG TPA: site-specific integrase [Gemmataceae bacterium]|nr:site-specific integrase [Gemmataceae bacterium]
MPHEPRPFYKTHRRTWYVEVGRFQHKLGKHPDGLPEPKKGKDGQWQAPPEIVAEFRRIMATPAEPPPPKSKHPLTVCILEAFLDWLSKRVAEGTKAQRTYDWYRKYLQSFAIFKTDEFCVADLTVDQLEPFHVYQWADSNPGWTTGKRGALTSVQRACNWAAKAGRLKSLGGKSPLAAIEKPPPGRREQLVSEEEYAEVLTALTSSEAHDLIVLSWETGMRPHELYTFEARFFEPENGRIVFPIKLSKGKKIQRVVYLNDIGLEIVKRRVVQFPSGPVLRNADGKPWNMSSTNCLFQRVRRTLGRRRIVTLGLMPPKLKRLTGTPAQKDPVLRKEHEEKVLARRKLIAKLAWDHGTKYSIYAFRHAFCTEALENGIDAVTVSVLMGHRDTTMIARHYAHVDQRTEHMRQAARKVRGA